MNQVMLTTNQKNIAAIIHLSTLCKYVFPLGNFIVPLIFWTLNKDKSDFIDKHGKQAINFQLSILLYAVVIASLTIPLFFFGIVNTLDFPEFWHMYDFDYHISKSQGINVAIITIVAAILTVAALILELVFIITATTKANQGEPYKYPITINFLK
jgi:hypothetical protein